MSQVDSTFQATRRSQGYRHWKDNSSPCRQDFGKQFLEEFEAECAPFQYALSTRASTDCVGPLLLAATDADPRVTILTVDGIGAYDHVLRSVGMPGARSLLPFVCMSHAQPSSYQWFDDQGSAHVVTQAEGGEQGEPLMPLLFSNGIQGALEDGGSVVASRRTTARVLGRRVPVVRPSGVRFLTAALAKVAGISCTSKRRGFGTEQGVIPDDTGENCTSHKRWKLWEKIPTVRDLQCAWQLLHSANLPVNHTMRTMPPSVSSAYCHAHNEDVWDTAQILLDGVPATSEVESQQLSTLPMRTGGLGLRSAVRCAPAAYWAS